MTQRKGNRKQKDKKGEVETKIILKQKGAMRISKILGAKRYNSSRIIDRKPTPNPKKVDFSKGKLVNSRHPRACEIILMVIAINGTKI